MHLRHAKTCLQHKNWYSATTIISVFWDSVATIPQTGIVIAGFKRIRFWVL